MPRVAHTVKKVRVNLDFHPEVKAQLESLRTRTHADSMSEVIRKALSLYELVIDIKDKQDSTEQQVSKVITVNIAGEQREIFLV